MAYRERERGGRKKEGGGGGQWTQKTIGGRKK